MCYDLLVLLIVCFIVQCTYPEMDISTEVPYLGLPDPFHTIPGLSW